MTINFYATPDDIRNLLRLYEVDASLKYVPCGCFDVVPREFASIDEVPDVGFTQRGETAETIYLLFDPSVDTVVEPIRSRHGGRRYCVYDDKNRKTVKYFSGAVLNDGTVIMSSFCCHDDVEWSQKILSRIREIMKKQWGRAFMHQGEYWVGPGAEILWLNGRRLTPGIKWSLEMDLKDIAYSRRRSV